jgi:hypothetical protein
MANVKQGNLTSPPQWWKHLKRLEESVLEVRAHGTEEGN